QRGVDCDRGNVSNFPRRLIGVVFHRKADKQATPSRVDSRRISIREGAALELVPDLHSPAHDIRGIFESTVDDVGPEQYGFAERDLEAAADGGLVADSDAFGGVAVDVDVGGFHD